MLSRADARRRTEPSSGWGRRALGRAVAVAALAAAAAAGGAGIALAGGLGQQVRAADMTSLRAIGVPAAWRVSQGSGVLVGVLDTGVNSRAPDLTGSVTGGPDYTAGANPPGYQPPHLHGTYIASIIAGHGSGPGRAGGIVGVAPRARILSVRVLLDDQEPGFMVYNANADYYDALASGIRYAVQHGARVLNASLGSTTPTRSVRQALVYAISHGVLVVAAAGNDATSGRGFTPYSYPASFPGVISVAAVGASGQRAFFSDRNSSVVVSAPGVNVAGDGPDGSYLSADGTSPASAFVAGVAALIRSKYPALSPALVTQAIVDSAQRRPAGGYSPGTGFGEVNAAGALTAAGQLAAGSARGLPAMSASGHFGPGATGPIVVSRRDTARIALLAAVAVLAAIGFLAAIGRLAFLRHRRPTPAEAEPAPEAGPAATAGSAATALSAQTAPSAPDNPTSTAELAEVIDDISQ
jgi:subtilisin family serine protease